MPENSTYTPIVVSPGQLADTLDLIHGTALAGCTTLGDDEGHVAVIRDWPSLSTGEELLWRLLAWVNGADDRPDWAELEAGLSVDNLPTVRAVLARNGISA